MILADDAPTTQRICGSVDPEVGSGQEREGIGRETAAHRRRGLHHFPYFSLFKKIKKKKNIKFLNYNKIYIKLFKKSIQSLKKTLIFLIITKYLPSYF